MATGPYYLVNTIAGSWCMCQCYISLLRFCNYIQWRIAMHTNADPQTQINVLQSLGRINYPAPQPSSAIRVGVFIVIRPQYLATPSIVCARTHPVRLRTVRAAVLCNRRLFNLTAPRIGMQKAHARICTNSVGNPSRAGHSTTFD